MNELRDYDDAVGAFLELQQIKSLPLNSWDYYSEFFETDFEFFRRYGHIQ